MGVIVSSSCSELTSTWCSSCDPFSEPVTNTQQGQRVCCHCLSQIHKVRVYAVTTCHKYTTRSEGMLSLPVTNTQGQRVCCHYLSQIHNKVRGYAVTTCHKYTTRSEGMLSLSVTNTQGQRYAVTACHKYTRSEGMLSLPVTNTQQGQRVCCHCLSQIHNKVRLYAVTICQKYITRSEHTPVSAYMEDIVHKVQVY